VPRGALRAGGGPELFELAAEFLAGGGPVGADVVAQILDVALEFQLVFLEPADVKLLARGAALELAGDVFLVVADDSIVMGLAQFMFWYCESWWEMCAHFVMMPVVLTPSVRWVTRNLPAALMGE
jgi:hypothetical protein